MHYLGSGEDVMKRLPGIVESGTVSIESIGTDSVGADTQTDITFDGAAEAVIQARPQAQPVAEACSETAEMAETAETQAVSRICEADGDVDEAWLDAIDERLSAIPSGVMQAFTDDGWRIFCTDKDIASYFYAGRFSRVKATTEYPLREIYVEDRLSAVDTAPVHEIGHYLDWHCGYVSYTATFASVYARESAAYLREFDDGSYYDEQELFANGFWKYIEEPGALADACPGLYALIDECVAGV